MTAAPEEGSAPEQVTQAPSREPAAPQIPAGHRLVTDQEYDAFKRIEQGYKGQTPILSKLGELGLKSPEDIERFGKTYGRMRESGIDPDRMFPEREPERRQEASPNLDINSLRDQIMADLRRETATESHQAATQRERGMIGGLVTKLVGESKDEDLKFLTRAIVNEAVSHASSLYPEGHALAGQLKPLSQDEFREIESAVEKRWQSFRGKQIADIAAGSKNAKPAPGPGPQGTATPERGPAHRPGGLPPKEAVLQAFEKLAAARGGGPTSGA